MKKKWYTCTPIAFKGDDTFFCRDSGLLCRGLQEMGFESRAIMPYSEQSGDRDDVLRTEYRNLFDAQWWCGLGLEGVLLYSWAAPKYTGIARAIKAAGLKLFVNLDNGGILSPYSGIINYTRDQYERIAHHHTRSRAVLQAALKTGVRLLCLGLIDYPRVMHIALSDVAGAVSPIAATRIQNYCRHLGCWGAAGKVCMIPHPIPPYTTYQGEAKRLEVLCVGRWADTLDKNTPLLVAVIAEMAARGMKIPVNIYGNGFEPWMDTLRGCCSDSLDFVRIRGGVPHDVLTQAMRSVKISLCVSRSESFNLASAEALCCGCSIVGPARASTPSFPYFVSQNSGTLARTYTATGFVDAIEEEVRLWKCGERSADTISAHWTGQLHVGRVLSNILSHLK